MNPWRFFSFDGHSSGREYAAVGFSTMALKYGLDYLVIRLATGQHWTPFDYLSPFFTTKTNLPDGVLLYLVAIMLPCAWLGLAMSVKRIRDAGLSIGWSLCFMVPFLNYLFMLMFCFLPQAGKVSDQLNVRPEPAALSMIRDSRHWVAIFIASLLGCLGMLLFVVWKNHYGLGLFLMTPFLMGLFHGYIYGKSSDFSRRSLLVGSATLLFVTSCFFLLFALEGLFCILMIAPIAYLVITFGSLVGAELSRKTAASPVHLAPLLAFSALFGVLEKTDDSQLPLKKISTTIVVEAPIHQVWERVIKFPDLPAPSLFWQHSGIAYPLRARIIGEGVGALRYCEFSTGPFIEPITAWEVPNRLAFDVTQSPPPMQEWNPFHDISPPHLDGFFQSRQGEFKLEAINATRTRLIGSTWYTLKIYPRLYWDLWADGIVHDIHRRVLNHVKNLAEADAGRS